MDIDKKSAMNYAPETLMLGYGYNPWWSEGSVKAPLFLTSTFLFQTAEDGEDFFKIAYGQKQRGEKAPGLIYSRVNNPELEILENRLAVWERADDAAAFASGMAAISTMMLALCQPGDQILYGIPVYGGTDYFLSHIAPKFHIETVPVEAGSDFVDRIRALKDNGTLNRVRMIYFETPCNPTITMTDIRQAVTELKPLFSTPAQECIVAVDNTFLGPVWQQPISLGADLSVYSATKFIGGHSDLVAGAILGRADLLHAVKDYRTILGSMAAPFVAWLMMRSLETLRIRMERQQENAAKVARWLNEQPGVRTVLYPGISCGDSSQADICRRQCTGTGSLISFMVHGGKARAFEVLNKVQLCKLAVSLGGTETLIEHPQSMTHSDVSPEIQKRAGITDDMIRISLGVENVDDIIRDLAQALA